MTLQNILCRIDHLLQAKVLFNGGLRFDPETDGHHNIINAGINEVDRIVGAEANSIFSRYGGSSDKIKLDIIKSFVASELNGLPYPGDVEVERLKVDSAFPYTQTGIKDSSKKNNEQSDREVEGTNRICLD